MVCGLPEALKARILEEKLLEKILVFWASLKFVNLNIMSYKMRNR